MTPAALRQKLLKPPNAVPDTGIDLKRPKSSWVPARILRFREAQELANTVWQNKFHRLMGEISRGLDTIPALLRGESRTWPLVKYRQIAYVVMYRFSGYSIAKIGHGFNKDHSTVVNALKKMKPHIAAVAAELPADAPAIEWARALKRRIAP